MKLIDYKKLEGCIEGDFVFDLLFDEEINKKFIEYIGKLGKLIYSESIPKPYFTIIVRGKYTLKGSHNNKSCRIIFPDSESYIYLEEIKKFISNFE
jgi:hypothetical protein